MNIAETIYQHVKAMPMAKAIEVLHFVEFLETKPDTFINNFIENDAQVYALDDLTDEVVTLWRENNEYIARYN